MRHETQANDIRHFMRELGVALRDEGRIYFTGGVSAVLHGWRQITVDIDLRCEPEPAGFFEALHALKEKLQINLKLAAPSDFIPELPGWRERSIFIARHGRLDFYHYDFYSQALAKIERGYRPRSGRRAPNDRVRVGEPGEIGPVLRANPSGSLTLSGD